MNKGGTMGKAQINLSVNDLFEVVFFTQVMTEENEFRD